MKVQELKSAGKLLIPRCFLAIGFFERFLGLMGRKSLPRDEGVLFPKCNSIHTFFMRFPIDVVLVSNSGEVLGVIEKMNAWRLLLPRKGVNHVVELAGNRSQELGIRAGMRLQYPGVWE